MMADFLTKEELDLLEAYHAVSTGGKWFAQRGDEGNINVYTLFAVEESGMDGPVQTRLAVMELYDNDDGQNDARFIIKTHNIFARLLAMARAALEEK